MRSAARVMWIMARTACRRWINQNAALISKRFRGKKRTSDALADANAASASPPRTATSRKRPGANLLILFLGLVFFWNGINLSSSFLAHLADRAAPADRVAVGSRSFKAITRTAAALPIVERSNASPERRALRVQQWKDYLKASLLHDLQMWEDCEDTCEARVEELLRTFETRGAAAFRAKPAVNLMSEDIWPAPQDEARLIYALGAILLVIAFTGLLLTLAKQDLGVTDWNLEWLFGFPVPARTLFLGRIFESTLANALTWVFYLPLFFTILWCSGHGFASVPLALVAALYFALLIASVQVVLGTFLRIHLPPHHLKNLQSLVVVIGSLLLGALLMSATQSTFVLGLFVGAPQSLSWLPWSLPVLLAGADTSPWVPAAGMLASAIIIPMIAMRLCERLVRSGLVTNAGPYMGVRSPKTSAANGAVDRRGPSWLHGILGKEMRLLMRDRTFLVQALFLPVFYVGLQVFLSPGFWQNTMDNSRHAAATAFGVAGFMLLSSALNVLAIEGKALWLLYTFPQELPRMLRQKALLWCAIASLYCGALIAFHLLRHPTLEALPAVFTAMIGVVIYAFIASGLGVLGTDPFETGPQRVSVMIIYVFMILAGMYAYAIYNPSIWGKIGQMVLSALLAFALWQKVRDHCPYLLDPTEAPPPSISLADGMIAALAFFVLQGVIALILRAMGGELAESIFLGFVTAGVLTTAFTLYVYWRRKVPALFATVGLTRSANLSEQVSFGRSLFWGLIGGVVAAAIAVLYLRALTSFEILAPLRDQAQELSLERLGFTGWWFLALAVLAAPVFEEYIFRGLVYRGLRRSLPTGLAVLAAAGIFAIVHPAASAVPVFIMGATAAFVFERTRLLIAPIMVHMVYNGIVLSAQSLI